MSQPKFEDVDGPAAEQKVGIANVYVTVKTLTQSIAVTNELLHLIP